MRLIDADALLDVLAEECPQIPNDKVDIHAIGMYHQYQHDTYMIVNAPTIDAVEQKHGHWELINNDYIACSLCGERLTKNRFMPYCDNCGASMTKGESLALGAKMDEVTE